MEESVTFQIWEIRKGNYYDLISVICINTTRIGQFNKILAH